MNYRVVHHTSYEYASPVTVSQHVARVTPRQTAHQSCQGFALAIEPAPTLRITRRDYFGNELCFFTIQEGHQTLDITAQSTVAVQVPPRVAPETSPPWRDVARLFRDPVSPAVVQPYEFVFDSPHVRASLALADYAKESFQADTPVLVGTRDLAHRIFTDFKYDPTATTVATPVEEVLEKRRGVCQDFAHLGLACLRSLGLPARYVSGYLRTHPPQDQPSLIGAAASHAWLAVFCPGQGWVDFDPTNDCQPAAEHITVAVGRDFGDVSPVAGILTGGGEHRLKVSVDVTAL